MASGRTKERERSTRKALLLGATGLVGGHVLERLLAGDDYDAVVTLGRRPPGRTHPRLTHREVDFEALEAHAALFAVDDVYCCLGTTMKQAGSKEAFRRVDHDYPVAAARLAHDAGASQYLLVSALGADSGSVFFYNRVKGEVEEAVAGVSFYGVYLFQPSLLTGDRDETRAGEAVAERVLGALSFALRGPLRRYRPTPARDVAEAMSAVARQRPGGVRRYVSEEIVALAAQQ